METFNLSRQSFIKPQFLETYNKPARSDVSEIRIVEMYQFGSLDCYKSICVTDLELQHILSLLSNNTMQNQKGMEALNNLIGTEGVSPVTKADARKKRNIIMVDTDVTNNIIMIVQNKINALNEESKITNKRGSFEIELTKREIFLMYFVLDMAHIVDLYIKRSDIQIDGKNDKDYDKQNKRLDVTDSCRQKLSVFFNPNMPFTRVK